MPQVPSLVDDKVSYTPDNYFAEQNIKITLLNGSTLEIWGTAFYNGNPLTTIGALPIATQAEAEAGVDNTKVMTPLRVNQAVTAKGAYTKAEADAKFVDAAGDIMTGPLDVLRVIIGQAPSVANHATRKDYVDAGDTAARAYADSVVAGVTVNTLNIYTKPESDAKFIDAAGDTFTGPIALAADPVSNMQASTKQYVDNKVASITVGSLSIYTKAEADTKFVDTAGDSMTGPLVVPTLTVNGLSVMRDINIGVGQGSVTVDKVVVRNAPSAPSDGTNKNYVDTGDLTNKNYIDTQVATRSNYTYVTDAPPPVLNYLVSTVGTVSTPNPGPLPAQCVFVVKWRQPPGNATYQTIAQQWAAANFAWQLVCYNDFPGTNDFFVWKSSALGNAADVPFTYTGGIGVFSSTVDESYAFAVDTAGTNKLQTWRLVNGSWQQTGAPFTSSINVPFNSTAPVVIGDPAFQGLIYSVELRTGLNPGAGSIIWRFDANEYTGTGSSFTDVRGRTWTLSNPAAIVKARPVNPGDVHIDTTGDSVYNYNGTSWINQGKLGAYTSVDNNVLPPSSFLTPFTGTAYTPDPGQLPTQCVLVYKVRIGPSITGPSIVSQDVPGDRGWVLSTYGNPAFCAFFEWDSSSAQQAGPFQTNGISDGTESIWAVSINHNNAGSHTRQGYRLIGTTWTSYFPASTPTFTPYDSSAVLRIGANWTNGNVWDSRIYSVELKTGLDPAAGTTVWKFDANDYPGSGTSYTDPRGRVWTLTNPAAITKLPVGTGDVHIDTSTDLVYKYSGTDWAYVGKLGDAPPTSTVPGNTTTGTGFPEGVVTAPIGTRYIDTVATCGAVEWIKASGTGNTGWKVVYGDTGWRDISTDLMNGWTGNMQIRRRDQMLDISLALTAPGVFNSVAYTFPTGFNPPTSGASGWGRGEFHSTATPASIYRTATASSQLNIIAVAGAVIYGERSMLILNSQPWPSTLPGTPVG